jgi:hypothetical protein
MKGMGGMAVRAFLVWHDSLSFTPLIKSQSYGDGIGITRFQLSNQTSRRSFWRAELSRASLLLQTQRLLQQNADLRLGSGWYLVFKIGLDQLQRLCRLPSGLESLVDVNALCVGESAFTLPKAAQSPCINFGKTGELVARVATLLPKIKGFC